MTTTAGHRGESPLPDTALMLWLCEWTLPPTHMLSISGQTKTKDTQQGRRIHKAPGPSHRLPPSPPQSATADDCFHHFPPAQAQSRREEFSLHLGGPCVQRL